MTMTITILGGGSFGSSLAVHLAGKGHDIKIWEFVAEQARKMQDERLCPLLPDVLLPDNILITPEIEEALSGSDYVLLVVPSDKVEMTMNRAKKWLPSVPIVICSKGFAKGRLLSDVVQEIVPAIIKKEIYCLYGPTHAEEVCRGMFSGIVLAGIGKQRTNIRKILESPVFKVDESDDLIGVQVSAALKNILAIFIGVIEGLGLGDNTKAYIATKGLAEIRELGLARGGKEETFYGLAGIGDVIGTCFSKHSRNRYVGEQIGQGKKLDDIIKEMKMVAEGVNALKEAMVMKKKFEVQLPLISKLNDVLFKGKDVKNILD